MYARAYIEITTICNRSCSFCPGTTRPLRRMSLSEFDTVTDRLKGVTEYLYYHVMGEPLTHPDLPDFIRLAKSKGFKSAITTNGTLLSKRGRELIEAGVYKVNISVHSFEDGEDSAAHGAYLDQILDFADEASKSGVLTVLRLWNLDGRSREEAHHEHNDAILDALHKAFPGEWIAHPNGFKIRDRLYLEWGERFDWPSLTCAPDYGERGTCYGLRDQIGILCDGTVVPCCLDGEGVINLGNLHRQEMEEILNSPRTQAMVCGFAQNRRTEALCRHCGYSERFSK